VAQIEVHGFHFDDRNEEKMAAHGVRPEQVYQVLDDFVVVRSRKSQSAPYLVIGRDWGGACIAIPIMPTGDPVVWRPVTAWYCKQSESLALARSAR
jgi:uncharacterized DUF497 family protein